MTAGCLALPLQAPFANHAAAGGLVSTLAGGVQGNLDGTGTSARFNSPYGVAVDIQGNSMPGPLVTRFQVAHLRA